MYFYKKKSMHEEQNGYRRMQDSNLRGETPVDFESTALTTRPMRHIVLYHVILTIFSLQYFVGHTILSSFLRTLDRGASNEFQTLSTSFLSYIVSQLSVRIDDIKFTTKQISTLLENIRREQSIAYNVW